MNITKEQARQARSHPCPKCGAPRGAGCVNEDRRGCGLHSERLDLVDIPGRAKTRERRCGPPPGENLLF